MKKTFVLFIAALVLVSSLGWSERPHPVFVPLTPKEQAIKAVLHRLVSQEDTAIVKGQSKRLSRVFLSDAEPSRDALRHAREREAFLESWSRARALKIANLTVLVRTPHITFVSGDLVNVMGVVSESYSYHYLDNATPYRFGLGVRHYYVLQRKDNTWYIRADDFTDPLDQNTRLPSTAKPAEGRSQDPLTPSAPPSFGAQKAVLYADQYCGAAPGCGNRGFYNPSYNNYNGDGGDCTNFISQALKAGGFREVGSWSYNRQSGEGDRAWSNAQGLADFLDGSERASLYAYGRYPVVTQPTARFSHGAVSDLHPGDLISYVERGRAVHTAIVVGFDPHGVPVVDSHTSDRYHVPWDLGWDHRTRYLLWHIRYPLPRSKTLQQGNRT